MAASIFSEIVSEGLLQVGDTSLTARMNFALNKWLRSQASLFLWPQLKRETSGIALAAGIQTLNFGNGLGGVTPEISRLNDPMKLYTSGFNTLQDIRIQTDWPGSEPSVSNTYVDPSTNTGAPDQAKVKQHITTKGAWTVVFNRVADRAYLIEINYYVIPVDVATSAAPWYPNDRTMVQCVYVEGLKYKKDPAYRTELDLLARMVTNDRMSEGQKPGINDGGIPLNAKFFR